MRSTLPALGAGLAALALAATALAGTPEKARPAKPAAAAAAVAPAQAAAPAAPAATAAKKLPGAIQAEPPPFTPGIFPCTQCHQGAGDTTRRQLAVHDEIVFEHDAEHRWCLDCHSNENRDVLHLSSGEEVPFTESYRLCGQCHGDKYRDWRVGVHGKRTGHWDGDKTYYLCVNCHNPHSPRFKPLKPEPAPRRPEDT